MKFKEWCVVIALVIALFVAVGFAGALFYVIYFANNSNDELITTNNATQPSERKPNIIILLADDTGYADFQSFGHPTQEWTGVDRMVKEGMKFTHWSTPAPVCSPSRAALMTGRYPIRNGVFGQEKVFGPYSSGGLPASELTLPEALKGAGYKTGMVGKWHLGINSFNSSDGTHLPKHHGFDYVGTNLPLSQLWFCDPQKYAIEEMKVCFLYNNDKIIEQPINLDTLTSRLVRDTKDFITENRDEQFFFYLAFPQTHIALFASPQYTGSSKRGPYGDMVNEMGWAVDQVLDHLIDLDIEKKTLVFFLSDHGPVSDGCGQGGSMGPFRGGKFTTWEGGVRIPAVAWWPGKIAPGTVDHSMISVLDLLPTALKLADVDTSTHKGGLPVDGKSFHKRLQGLKDEEHHNTLFYYCDSVLSAVRYKKYKIYYYTLAPPAEGMVHADRPFCRLKDYDELLKLVLNSSCEKTAVKQEIPLVFDVESDPEEVILLDTNRPDIQDLLETVKDIVKTHRLSIIQVESEINKPVNKSLQPCCDPPLCTCNYNAPGTRLEDPKK